jgi:hypothetical protein
MNDLIDMIASNESPIDVSDKIKEILFSKSAEKIDEFKPVVADILFNGSEEEE